jgi:hypothetical protein
MQKVLTIGELRNAIDGAPDDAPVTVSLSGRTLVATDAEYIYGGIRERQLILQADRDDGTIWNRVGRGLA